MAKLYGPENCFAASAAREKVVGWYSTGPRLREADLDINELMTKYVETPLLVICEVQVCLPDTKS